ncbi:Retrovirus-related Pol polyprotein from transposon TNT 1-94 [Sesamum angolense]|uniref:Retrovirus-related Pol polyprotein from transposon TNT 1-94 n=1 Tax=Sesamum angolense TaxID=2727404 RepID=A0AAE1W6L9_9LAMI|nr:Retrovirus-related Pol polyprotein from transposon TNT 1-94 [Sesamum angolense]
MKTYFQSQKLWELVEEGVTLPEDSSTSSSDEKGKLENKKAKDSEALYYIQTAVADHIFPRISVATSAKEAWSILQKEYQGSAKVRIIKLQTLRRDFENMKMKDSETIDEYYTKVRELVNQLKAYGEDIPEKRVVEKLLISVTEKYDPIVTTIEETKDITTLTVTELVGSLEAYEKRRIAETGEATWYIDSAASNHMTYNKGAFQTLDESFKTNVKLVLAKRQRSNWSKVDLLGYSQLPDLIYTGNNEKMIQDFKEDMMKTFEMSDLGLMHFFLGIEINQEKEGIFICQRKYTETLLKKFKMESCKTVYYSFGYWRKVPERRWITKSRWLHVQKSNWKPTISNCHKTRYYVRHKSAIKVYAESEPNSDWAGSVDDMKSTSGYTFSLGSGIFSWASKKQATVAQSSAEAEYIAAAATSNQAIWLRRILEDIGDKQEEPTTIYCDNKSAIAITKNPVQHSRTKHINIKYHSLREATTRGEIELKYCSTEEQLADIFTKALPQNKFEELRMKIGVCHKHIKGEY